MPPKGKSSKRKQPKQTYQHIENAVNITLYDTTGTTINPLAKEEFEEFALHVAQKYPNLLISIAVT